MCDDIIDGVTEEDFGTFKLITVTIDRRESKPVEPSEQSRQVSPCKDWPEFKSPSSVGDQVITAAEWCGDKLDPTVHAVDFKWGYEFEEDGEFGILPVTFSSIPPKLKEDI